MLLWLQDEITFRFVVEGYFDKKRIFVMDLAKQDWLDALDDLIESEGLR